jgi:parallel beta-helix repeat protein
LSNTKDNVIEHNTITGNTNGVVMTSTAQGNIIRRNLVVGNPPIQIDLDHSSAKGVDIKNQAPSGANTFQGNRCLTAVNAPCPAVKRQPEEKEK